jgi:hypothetical protein
VAFPTKTLLALAGLVACSVASTFVPHPTRDGPLLPSLRPELAGLGGSGTFLVPQPDVPAPVVRVALPATAGATTTPATHTIPATSTTATATTTTATTTTTAATTTTTVATTAATTGTAPEVPGVDGAGARTSLSGAARARDVLAAVDALLEQLGDDPAPLQRPCIDDDDHRGCRGRALDRFYEGLLRVSLGEAERPVRFSQFGDSLTGREHFPAALRRLLQEQFGDGGHGYVPLADPGNGVYAADVVWSGRGFTKKDIAWHTGADFGVGGLSWLATPEATTTIGPAARGPGARVDRVGLLYVPTSTPASVVVVDRQRAEEVPLRGTPGRSRIAWLPWPGRTITLQGFSGTGALHGLLLENSGPGVIVDNLGVVSARMPHLARIDPRRLDEQIALLDPTVLSFFYGGVAAEDEGWGSMPERTWATNYREAYGAPLARLRRAHPQRDCLVLSTLTRAVDENGRIAVFPSVPLRVDAQRQAAHANGCAFWSTFDAIGGRDGPARWVAHRPRLLALDLRHPTRDGYRQLARLFYTSLMHGFRGWLVERLGHGA